MSIKAETKKRRAAGAGTVNAPTNPQSSGSTLLTLDCFNNSGGAFTFTMNAIYHTTAAIAPANGFRRVVMFIWDPTNTVFLEVSRTAVDLA